MCDRDDLKTPPVNSNKDVQPKHNENEGKSDFSCQVTVACTYPADNRQYEKESEEWLNEKCLGNRLSQIDYC